MLQPLACLRRYSSGLNLHKPHGSALWVSRPSTTEHDLWHYQLAPRRAVCYHPHTASGLYHRHHFCIGGRCGNYYVFGSDDFRIGNFLFFVGGCIDSYVGSSEWIRDGAYSEFLDPWSTTLPTDLLVFSSVKYKQVVGFGQRYNLDLSDVHKTK
jgi:hypothetical protein